MKLLEVLKCKYIKLLPKMWILWESEIMSCERVRVRVRIQEWRVWEYKRNRDHKSSEGAKVWKVCEIGTTENHVVSIILEMLVF